VVGVNRCGTDPTLSYPGCSLIVEPSGQIIAAAEHGEQLLSATVTTDIVHHYRTDLPFLKDVRTDYDKLVG
jgi:omega-amidase